MDQGKTMTREEKVAVWNRAFGQYLPVLTAKLLEKLG